MREVIIRTVVMGGIILAGVLLISSGLQLMIRFWGVGPVISMASQPASESYRGEREELHRRAVDNVREAMGLDCLFVPDLWPFDNESLWSNPERLSNGEENDR
jgi:hypothetical protein